MEIADTFPDDYEEGYREQEREGFLEGEPFEDIVSETAEQETDLQDDDDDEEV